MSPLEMMKKVNPATFKADMEARYPNMRPQDIVGKMVSSGQVSMAQFEEARNIASLLGIKM